LHDRADQQTNGVSEPYSVSITGGSPVKINGILTSGGNVSTAFDCTPVGDRVVYGADQERMSCGRFESDFSIR
jgi:hypothetical protein